MKTLFSIVGNVCSGKSSIIKNISLNENIKSFSIDDYRIKYNASCIMGEWNAWLNLTNDISICDIAILESSGLSQNLTDIYKLFDNVIIILINCDNSILIERFKKRNESNYIKVPFCYSINIEAPESMFDKISHKLNLLSPNYIYDSGYLSSNHISNEISNIILKYCN